MYGPDIPPCFWGIFDTPRTIYFRGQEARKEETWTATLKSIYDGDETDTQELTGTQLPKSLGTPAWVRASTQRCSLLIQQLPPSHPSERPCCKPRSRSAGALSSSARTSRHGQTPCDHPRLWRTPQTQPEAAPTSCSMPAARGPARQRGCPAREGLKSDVKAARGARGAAGAALRERAQPGPGRSGSREYRHRAGLSESSPPRRKKQKTRRPGSVFVPPAAAANKPLFVRRLNKGSSSAKPGED